MITLYEFRASPYCAKVKKLLQYKKLPFTLVEVSFLRREQPRRLSGQGRVPVIDDGGKVVNDSTAIALYLEEAYPDPPALPADGAARARVLLIEDWADEAFADQAIPFKLLTPGNAERLVAESIELQGRPALLAALQPLGPLVLRTYARRRRSRGRSLAQIARDFGRDLDVLEQALTPGPWLADERPSLADFAVYGFLGTMEGLAGMEEITRRPRLGEWYARVKAL